jgi:hypothetical protein
MDTITPIDNSLLQSISDSDHSGALKSPNCSSIKLRRAATTIQKQAKVVIQRRRLDTRAAFKRMAGMTVAKNNLMVPKWPTHRCRTTNCADFSTTYRAVGQCDDCFRANPQPRIIHRHIRWVKPNVSDQVTYKMPWGGSRTYTFLNQSFEIPVRRIDAEEPYVPPLPIPSIFTPNVRSKDFDPEIEYVDEQAELEAFFTGTDLVINLENIFE